MHVLHVAATMNPIAGGVPEAVWQLNAALERIGDRSEILTMDSSDAPWVSSSSAIVHALGPSQLNYRYNSRLTPWLEERGRSYDAVIEHGIWQYPALATAQASQRAGFPYLVYAHGQLDPWFKHASPLKHAKKWLYWPWGGYRVLRNASAVVFTSEQERLVARESFWLYQANEVVVQFGLQNPQGDVAKQEREFLAVHSHLRDKRVLLFLSRLHEKKGCDMLVEAFAQASNRDPNLHLVMAGPDQDGWQRRLEALARIRGVSDRITWTGMLTGALKWGAYAAADAFVLPSHSENFGIVVAEALAYRVPVLITNKVNIWREIDQAGAGLVEEDTQEGVVALLYRWLALSSSETDAMRLRARSCFEAHFEAENAGRALHELIMEKLYHCAPNIGARSSSVHANAPNPEHAK